MFPEFPLIGCWCVYHSLSHERLALCPLDSEIFIKISLPVPILYGLYIYFHLHAPLCPLGQIPKLTRFILCLQGKFILNASLPPETVCMCLFVCWCICLCEDSFYSCKSVVDLLGRILSLFWLLLFFSVEAL